MTSTITIKEETAPGTPPSGYSRLYVKSDGKYYYKDDAGTEFTLVGPTGATGPGGMVNRVINGDMRIDQANVAAAVGVNAAGPFYGPDMVDAGGTASAGVFNMQQLSATPPTGYKYYVQAQTATADAAPAAASAYFLSFKIEGNNVIDLSLGTASALQITISFWARSSLTGSFSGALTNSAFNRSYPFSFTINSANTWEQKTVTLTGDTTGTWLTDNGIGLRMLIDIGSGANFRGSASAWAASGLTGVTGAVRLISTLSATLWLTGVQIESGATMSPFERRDLMSELARCQRYYQKTFPQTTKPAQNAGVTGSVYSDYAYANAAGVQGIWDFAAVMRATPTLTTYNTGAANANFRQDDNASDASTATSVSDRRATVLGSSTTNAGHNYQVHVTADARL